jgi:hypothetical protein
MKGNHEPKIGKYYFKEKKQYLTSSNSKQYLKNTANKTKAKKNNLNEFIIRKVEPKSSLNYTKINTYPKKFKYNNGLIKKSSYRKNIEPLYKSENLSAYDSPINNLSSYKKLLDMMVEEYANNNENSKENINKLLKKSSEKNKNQKINLKKAKILSPLTKNYILNANNKIKRSKPLYHTSDERNEKRNKEIYNIKVIKIQSCFRGFFLRKIVERGIKKYYGVAFIFKLLEKFISKRNKRTFKIIKENQLTLSNDGYQNTKYRSTKNDILYTRKKYYNNNLNNDNSEKNTFSFSKYKKELHEINDYNKKFDNSKENKISKINSYNLKSQKNSKITQSMKEQRAPGYDLNYKILSNNYNSLTSSVIKKEKKNEKFSNFNKKYQEIKNQPINVNTAYFFKRPIYKKNHSNRKRYIYIHKNINQKQEKNISSEKLSSDISSNKNLNLNYENNNNNFNHININNNTLNNIYKYILVKIFKFIKNKFYETYFHYFIYQLKIKRKVGQLKNFSFLMKIIMKIDKKTLKKYLNIYREKVLTLQATELIGYNNSNAFNLKSIIKSNDSNKFQIESEKKEYSNNTIINHNKTSDLENENKNKEDLLRDGKKDLLLKLFGIKNKLIGEYISKYFNKWKNLPNSIKSKNEKMFKKNMQFNKNTLYKKYNNYNNKKWQKITVNKRQLRIKRIINENYSQNSEIKKNDTSSKEKKMRIIKRISNTDEYLPLYNSYNKKLKNSNLFSSDIFLEEDANTIDKVYYIINKIEIKKLLFKFFTFWKKNRK